MNNHDVATLIEAWFAKNDGDGDFTRPPRNYPYTLIGVSRSSGTIIYCSKLLPYLFLDNREVPSNVGLLQRYGLPNQNDLGWMRQMVGKRKLLFFGDLDPADLLVFAWLRRRLRGVRLEYLGINDSLLAAVGFEPADSVPSVRTIRLRGSEKKAMQVLAKAFPDFPEIVGERCAGLLARGHKLEIEAILSLNAATRDALFAALRVH
jgi:hypothetical protein